jgi:hypothetical protein
LTNTRELMIELSWIGYASISWGHWMSKILASIALVSAEDEGVLVRGGVLVPVGALVREGARV